MKFYPNYLQIRKALEYFKPENHADILDGDVYIDTNTNEIVFNGNDYPVAFSLANTDFVLDCDEEPLCLIACIQSCNCDINNYHITIVEQHGNILAIFDIDGWCDSPRIEICKELEKRKLFYDDLSFIYV